MTREEIAKDIRQIDRRCRGPFHDEITLAHVKRMSDDLKGVLGAKSEEEATKVSARALKSTLLAAEDTKPQARELDDLMRPGCGNDFNDIVEAGPKDGELYPYECPRCGVTGIYRAPLYPEASDA